MEDLVKRIILFAALCVLPFVVHSAAAQDNSTDGVPAVDYSVPTDQAPPIDTGTTITTTPLTVNQGEDEPLDPDESLDPENMPPNMPAWGDGFTTGEGSPLVPGFVDDGVSGTTVGWPSNAPVDDLPDGDGSGRSLPPGIEGVEGGGNIWRPDGTGLPPVYGGAQDDGRDMPPAPPPPDDGSMNSSAAVDQPPAPTTTPAPATAPAPVVAPAPAPVPSGPAPALGTSTAIASAGPLTNISISSDLNCGVNYGGISEFFGDTACATELAIGPYLFGPVNIPAGNNPGGFIPVSQTSDGKQLTTVVNTDYGFDWQLTETDSYTAGQNSYSTTVAITNNSEDDQVVTLYHGGDCLQYKDKGLGNVGPDGSVACVAGSQTQRWTPVTGGSSYFEGVYSALWSAMNDGTPFPNTCDCGTSEDNAAGLSWSLDVPAGETRSVSMTTSFSN